MTDERSDVEAGRDDRDPDGWGWDDWGWGERGCGGCGAGIGGGLPDG
ncbi:hypothetical protein GCM10022384_60250 [Streptomyces marokkonensis]|uniref:Uncharacterized protein n=1 Tax=Streptomyces marokkonensis TaxID=324855 RepID=A0ABP7S335_9ACTN